MDWTEIITGLITAASAIGVAYLTFGKKNNQANVTEILEKVRTVEEQNKESKEQLRRQAEQLAELREKAESQEAQLAKMDTSLEDDVLRTMRLDLLHAIETDPNNTMVILELAQKYFVELKGNCYMSSVFQEWAADHKVNITSMFNRG